MRWVDANGAPPGTGAPVICWGESATRAAISGEPVVPFVQIESRAVNLAVFHVCASSVAQAGVTPLHVACAHGQCHAVEALLLAGADANATTIRNPEVSSPPLANNEAGSRAGDPCVHITPTWRPVCRLTQQMSLNSATLAERPLSTGW